jgi:hypothetical protein
MRENEDIPRVREARPWALECNPFGVKTRKSQSRSARTLPSMTPFSRTGRSVKRFLADRLDMLQQTLEHLGGRLREGIATAIGQTVSEAAQVAVRSFLAGMQPAPAVPEAIPYRPFSGDEPSSYDGWGHPHPYDFSPEIDELAPEPRKSSRLPAWTQIRITHILV